MISERSMVEMAAVTVLAVRELAQIDHGAVLQIQIEKIPDLPGHRRGLAQLTGLVQIHELRNLGKDVGGHLADLFLHRRRHDAPPCPPSSTRLEHPIAAALAMPNAGQPTGIAALGALLPFSRRQRLLFA